MKLTVRIEDLYGGQVWVLRGTARQVTAAVLLIFPWLRSPNPVDREDLEALLEDLGSQQMFMVEIASA